MSGERARVDVRGRAYAKREQTRCACVWEVTAYPHVCVWFRAESGGVERRVRALG